PTRPHARTRAGAAALWCPAPPLGRGAHLLLARQVPPAGRRLRTQARTPPGVGAMGHGARDGLAPDPTGTPTIHPSAQPSRMTLFAQVLSLRFNPSGVVDAVDRGRWRGGGLGRSGGLGSGGGPLLAGLFDRRVADGGTGAAAFGAGGGATGGVWGGGRGAHRAP